MQIDYTKLTVDEIRKLIVADSGGIISAEMAAEIKGKASLIAAHETIIQQFGGTTHQQELESSGVAVFEDGSIETGVTDALYRVPTRPKYSSPEWSDFVMSQFTEDELVEGNPNIHGLRRVTELLLGEVAESRIVDYKTSPDPGIPGKAVVVYEVVIAWALDAGEYLDLNVGLPLRKYQGIASAWVGNTDDEYAVFPEAIAETRAEARALRKALRINKVSADEVTKRDVKQFVEKALKDKDSEWNEDEKINDMQVNLIKVMCDRLGIDVLKFINKNGDNYTAIEQVTKGVATKMISTLNAYQSNGNDVSIPPSILKGTTNED